MYYLNIIIKFIYVDLLICKREEERIQNVLFGYVLVFLMGYD